jgi:ribosomal-protein-alanine N-acetyltransferase
MKAEDIEAVMKIERESVEAAHWPLAQYALLVERDAAGVSAATESEASRIHRLGLVVEVDGRVAGFLAARAVVGDCVAEGEAELENMAVSEEVRRRGVGAKLLEEFLGWCATFGCARVHLEVRESNAAARRLYERYGFREDGRRRDYYKDPAEDAVTMALAVTS